jgi:predicted DNA-binding protein
VSLFVVSPEIEEDRNAVERSTKRAKIFVFKNYIEKHLENCVAIRKYLRKQTTKNFFFSLE